MKILLIFILLFSVSQAAEKSGVAVLNFKSDDLTEVQKSTLAGSLSNSMRSDHKWSVITWEEVARILESTRNRMLLDCDDTQCVDAVAGALNVQYLVSGEVSSFGTLWMVNVRLIDSWAAKTVRSASRTVNSIEDIVRVMPAIAAEIMGDVSPRLAGGPRLYLYGEGGRVEASPQRDFYRDGEEVTLSPRPNRGFVFDSWGGDISGTSYPTTITMSKDLSVEAVFIKESVGKRRRVPIIVLSTLGAGGAIMLANSLSSSDKPKDAVISITTPEDIR